MTPERYRPTATGVAKHPFDFQWDENKLDGEQNGNDTRGVKSLVPFTKRYPPK